jgi:hypoxanthine phosphoribosyltransferase
MARKFAHPAEAAYARLLDKHGIPWEYEPHTFLLETDAEGRVLEAVTPDFYLPTIGAYVECTTTKPHLVSRKRRKARKLRDKHGAIVTLFERDDLERLLRKRPWWRLF